MAQRKKATPHQDLDGWSQRTTGNQTARFRRAEDHVGEKARSDLARQVREESEPPQKGAP
jgi:hypothetical protein